MGTVDHLPDIGDQRRQDQKRRRLDGRQNEGQQAHRNGRQPETDDALAEARHQEDREDEGECRQNHAALMEGGRALRNVENTESAFGLSIG